MGIVLALLVPIGIAIRALYAAVSWAWSRYKATAMDGVYPGSPQHQAALKSVEDRTAPAFTAWPSLPTEVQAAHDQAATDADTDRGCGRCGAHRHGGPPP
ncbi:hypothetical protein [Streptomyces sp. NPDC019890]|uniref:hypothetical protein n=1 Tax=Streptomyces sp. NPDC019890 TaxID=3365064 RepID=UPI00384F224C